MGAGIGSAGEDGAFVGRARELSVLAEGVEDALRGRGRLFMVSGEPGIGKTRLADQATGAAGARGAAVLWGRCWEAGGAPAFWPWVQALRTLVRAAAPGTLPQMRSWPGSAAVGQLVPELGTEKPPEPAPNDPAEARFALFDDLTGFLRRAALDRPILIALDDLHAADRSSLLLLRFLASELRDARLMVLALYRDAEARLDPAVGSVLADVARDGTMLPLVGLRRDEARDLIAARIADPTEATIDELFRAAAGNPFFLTELTSLHASARPDRRLPDGVREAIARRLRLLPEATVALLSAAAVIGPTFDLDVLSAASGEPAVTLLPLLDPAVSMGIVTAEAAPPGRFRFGHDLVRETLYTALPSNDRAGRHARIASALEQMNPNDRIAEIAFHTFRALPLVGSARAVDASLRAGAISLELLAYEDAVAHFGRALDALGHADKTVDAAEVLMRLADARWRAGDLADARATFSRAGEIAEAAGDASLLARAALGRAQVDMGATGTRAWEPDERLNWMLRRTLSLTDPEDNDLRARTLATFGASLHFTPQREEGIDMTTEAVAIAQRLGDQQTLAACLAAHHLAIWGPDRLEERTGIARELVRLALETGNRELLLQGYLWLHRDLFESGGIAEAEDTLDRYIQLAREMQRPQYDALIKIVEGARANFLGRFDDAERLGTEALAYAVRENDGALRTGAETLIILNGLDQGRTDHLHDIARDQIAWRADHRWVAIEPWMVLGDPDEIRRELEHVVRPDGVHVEHNAFWLGGVEQVAVAAASLGDHDRAAIAYAYLAPYADRISVLGRSGVFRRGPMALYVGMLATTLDLFAEAERHLGTALRTAEAAGSPTWTARASCELGRMWLRAGDHARAGDTLRRALRLAEPIGMGSIVEAAIGLLDRAPEPAPVGERWQADGDVWGVSWRGQGARVRDSKGMRYLAQLLVNPHREIHALDLAAGLGAPSGSSRETTGLRTTRLGDAGDVLDGTAKEAYRARLADLREELEAARTLGEEERAARAEDEIAALSDELAAAVGFGGRGRKLDPVAERARVSVTKAIRTAVDRVAEHLPALGDHLRDTVRTGTYCAYQPDPAAPPTWRA